MNKILVVDDEPLMCEIFSEILKRKGYDVLTAHDGQEALDLLKDEQVNLLLSDVIMPNVDGFELAAKVTELYPEIKIQLVSGYSETNNDHLVPPELYQQILAKPVEAAQLLMRVERLLN